MTIANIISAIGNNSSVYPLLVRDCGIENVAKVAMTYKENNKESKKMAYLAARERFLDEYTNSAIWLGGIPLVSAITDKIIRSKGFNPDVNMKLFKEDAFQGITKNIKKFEETAPKAVADLREALGRRKSFEKLAAGKFLASTVIPMSLIGWIAPSLIFASTAKKLDQEKAVQNMTANDITAFKGKISFTGGVTSALANMSNLQKMQLVDGGYAVGRVSVERTPEAKQEMAFKMAGMFFLNFVAPKWIAKGLDKATGANLDPIMLADKEFIARVKNKTLDLPEKTDKKLLSFIDNKKNLETPFVKFADKLKKIKMIKEDGKFVCRDPRAWVDLEALGKFRDQIAEFTKKADAPDFDKLVGRMKGAKYFNILANIGLSSFLLAYCLPKAQFAFRRLITGSSLEPGIAGTAQKKGVDVERKPAKA